MKKALIIIGVSVLLIMMSFKSNPPSKKLNFKSGTYSICSCDNSHENSLRIELTINENNTFQYFDNSNPTKKVDITGKWALDNNIIVLKDYDSDVTIHTEWKIDENEKCLKSRKGLNFTRLCHIQSCK